MKPLFRYCTAFVLLLGLLHSPVTAQDTKALAIIKRYERVSGLNKISDSVSAPWHIQTKTLIENTEIKLDMYYLDSTRLYAQASIFGMDCLLTMNGRQNITLSINGETVPMPEEISQTLRNQLISPDTYRWREQDYTFMLVDSLKVGKRTCPGVQITPKKETTTLEKSVVYFDPRNGMPVFMKAALSQNGITQQIYCRYSQVKRYGALRLPSHYVMSIHDQAKPFMEISIELFEYGGDMPDSISEAIHNT